MLTLTEAGNHPRFREAAKRFATYPTVNPIRYEQACWMRWLAFAAMGGGVMVDTDVFPSRFFRGFPHVESDVVVLNHGGVPCAVMATAKGAEEIVSRAISWGPRTSDTIRGKPHTSDMYMFQGENFPRQRFCLEVGDKEWESAPLIHFAAGACQKVGVPDKVQAVNRFLIHKR